MTNVTIYTTSLCPYCRMAKNLLATKNVNFTEVDVSESSKRDAMRTRAGGRNSVPQIFIGNTHVGGCDDLHALEAQGKLDGLLAA